MENIDLNVVAVQKQFVGLDKHLVYRKVPDNSCVYVIKNYRLCKLWLLYFNDTNVLFSCLYLRFLFLFKKKFPFTQSRVSTLFVHVLEVRAVTYGVKAAVFCRWKQIVQQRKKKLDGFQLIRSRQMKKKLFLGWSRLTFSNLVLMTKFFVKWKSYTYKSNNRHELFHQKVEQATRISLVVSMLHCTLVKIDHIHQDFAKKVMYEHVKKMLVHVSHFNWNTGNWLKMLSQITYYCDVLLVFMKAGSTPGFVVELYIFFRSMITSVEKFADAYRRWFDIVSPGYMKTLKTEKFLDISKRYFNFFCIQNDNHIKKRIMTISEE